MQARAEPNLGGRSAERPYCRVQPKISKQKSQRKQVNEEIFVQARAEPNLGGRSAERPYCRVQPNFRASECNRACTKISL